METSPPLQQHSVEQMYCTSSSMEKEMQFSQQRAPSIDEIEPCIPRMLEVPMEAKSRVTYPPNSPPPPITPCAFMDCINRREVEKGDDRNDDSSKIERNFISTNIKPWDGPWESFPMLKNQIVTATLKAGMSHSTDNEVIQQYVATGNHPQFP